MGAGMDATAVERRGTRWRTGSTTRLDLLRWAIAAVLIAAAVVLAARTRQWPIIWDAQVFHYINFLISRGWQPYGGITDMNLPGAYLADRLVLHTLGGGALGWRVYDLLLLAVATASAIALCRPYEWVGGLYAGVQFALWHALDGPYNTGQRDLLLSVLLIAAFAFLFAAERKNIPALAAGFGFCVAAACTIKPTAAPLGMVVLGLALNNEVRSRRPWTPVLWASAAGAAVPLAVVCGYMQYHHAFGALFTITRRITPFYSALNDVRFGMLLRWMVAGPVRLVFLLWVALAAWNVRAKVWQESGREWERWAIVAGVLFGAFSYLIQRKGYVYHRYPLMLFLLLSFAVEAGMLLRSRRRPWPAAMAALGLGAFLLVPAALRGVLAIDAARQNQLIPALDGDLQSLGGAARLERRVQCLDLVDGCLGALFHERIVQSTGVTGDLLLFSPEKSPVVDFYRNAFLRELALHPPDVFVLTNEWYSRPNTWTKVDEFPQLAAMLRSDFHPVVQRTFDDDQHSGYRIYVRNGASLPALAPASHP